MSLPKSGSEAITAIKQARSASVQEPEHIVHSNGRYSPLLTRMMNKRVESNVKQVIHLYDEPPAAPVKEPVAHCEAGPEHCQQCHLEDRSLALAAAVRYVKNNTPKLVSDEICMALASITAAQRQWVGLTDKEREGILDREFRQWWSRHDAVCRAIEAKLKEKNNG
jgi:hypothetical protein